MNVLIVDTEEPARQRLAAIVRELDVERIAEADSGLAALRAAREQLPDVIIMDLLMPEVSGIDVAEHLGDTHARVIFQTSLHERVLRDFRNDGIDYVLKPVARIRVNAAIERARDPVLHRHPPFRQSVLARLRHALRDALPAPAGMLLRDGADYIHVPYARIVRFVSEGDTIYVHTEHGRLIAREGMDELQERTRGIFVRANSTELVNIERIARLIDGPDASFTALLADGDSVRVSRARARALQAVLAH
jgi:two-component system, LytTR family, response regulator